MLRIMSDHDVQGQLTLADPNRIAHDRQYAESVVERLFDILIDISVFRGAGRLFLP